LSCEGGSGKVERAERGEGGIIPILTLPFVLELSLAGSKDKEGCGID
jgi:hypothetical protein